MLKIRMCKSMLTDIRNTKASCFLEQINDVSPGPFHYTSVSSLADSCVWRRAQGVGVKKPKKTRQWNYFYYCGQKIFFLEKHHFTCLLFTTGATLDVFEQIKNVKNEYKISKQIRKGPNVQPDTTDWLQKWRPLNSKCCVANVILSVCNCFCSSFFFCKGQQLLLLAEVVSGDGSLQQCSCCHGNG